MWKTRSDSRKLAGMALRFHLSVASVYIATDLMYDYGLLQLPTPYGEILYYGRYIGMVVWYARKWCKKHELFKDLKRKTLRL
jgi:hypothetical protein